MAEGKQEKTDKPEAKKQEAKQQPQQRRQKGDAASRGATSIIRLVGKDVDGALNVERALSKVKGIGLNLSHSLSIAIESKLSIPRATPVGSLSEKQVSDLEDLVKNPAAAGIPSFMLNRNKDSETGLTTHNTGNELLFSMRQDVNRDTASKTWRGYRHQHGQKVRGQHTRSTGRTGATIGVTKKAVKAAEAAAKKGPAATAEKK